MSEFISVGGFLLLYPMYVLIMAGVLAVCVVPRREIAKWALKQADRQRFTDLLRAAGKLPPLEPPPDSKSEIT
jgi:hypothetical protein